MPGRSTQPTRYGKMQSEFYHLFQEDPNLDLIAVQERLEVLEGQQSLTELERQLCVLMGLNFDNYEIAQLANIELGDVELERERIRQKLHVAEDQSIRDFMRQKQS